MDRNSAIGFVLIALILVGYTWYTMPDAEEQAQWQQQQDSLAALVIEEQTGRPTKEKDTFEEADAYLLTADPDQPDTARVDALEELRISRLEGRYGIFHPAASGEALEVVLEDERMQVSIDDDIPGQQRSFHFQITMPLKKFARGLQHHGSDSQRLQSTRGAPLVGTLGRTFRRDLRHPRIYLRESTCRTATDRRRIPSVTPAALCTPKLNRI